MADFDKAYKLTGHNEGGYANNPNDHGGETYAGISRKFWPNWSGWSLIDLYKKQHGGVHGIDAYMSSNPIMQKSVASFYRQNFWDVNKLDLINDQQLANNVYDFGVNSGVDEAAKVLQSIVGVAIDGVIGNHTIAETNSLDAKNTYDRYNAERIRFYHSLSKNPGQLVFLKSWISRIKPYYT
ncbi:glycosyl hydrolase 108 family protein [Mucilaginibacter sp.]|uniref:glycoside hydrolase family 108 protein n=1 Tax=Mucilaginibacter sp. TaxID=1882438 RepID=UPI00261C5781|nr:glycosyl hydrolase 108 family protein [Mucilaginibacter sp.]MDB5032248.1 hypothetical protein [Mucilaginibacter sp.]